MEKQWNNAGGGGTEGLAWPDLTWPDLTWLSATLSTRNPPRTDPRANPGLCDEKPVTNRLSYGTAWLCISFLCVYFYAVLLASVFS
jgi:hypothetical protein